MMDPPWLGRPGLRRDDAALVVAAAKPHRVEQPVLHGAHDLRLEIASVGGVEPGQGLCDGEAVVGVLDRLGGVFDDGTQHGAKLVLKRDSGHGSSLGWEDGRGYPRPSSTPTARSKPSRIPA